MQLDKILVGNIQRFSLHDGPGIRTTVFLMGCNIRCPWCANPENLEMKPRFMRNGKTGEMELYGNYYSVDQLYNEVIKDEPFFSDGGGITFSGGEALLQAEQLENLWKKLKLKGINLCVETALFADQDKVEIASQYIDEFIVDVKILGKDDCRAILKGDRNQFLENIDFLFHSGKDIYLRFPVSEPETLNDENIEMLIKFLKKYKPHKIELFSIHNLGKTKYEALGLPFKEFEKVSVAKLQEIQEMIQNIGINCEIITI